MTRYATSVTILSSLFLHSSDSFNPIVSLHSLNHVDSLPNNINKQLSVTGLSNYIATPHFNNKKTTTITAASKSATGSNTYSSPPYDDEDNNSVPQSTAKDLPSTRTDDFIEVDDDVDTLSRIKKKALNRDRPFLDQIYEVTIPISDDAKGTVSNGVGMTLRQVGKGRMISDLALDVDSLRLFEEIIADPGGGRKRQYLGKGASQDLIDEDFSGVIVSSVDEGANAWNAGVRAGDILLATSATMGKTMWLKSTLDGVRSAISSRRVMLPNMTFRFRKSRAQIGMQEVVEEFELTLKRPLGIEVKDADDGYVQISGFTEDAPDFIKHSLNIGDRITAADSSLGIKMWPVSNVEGLVASYTSRLPDQPIKLRFERVISVGKWEDAESVSTVDNTDDATASLAETVDGFRQLKRDTENSGTSPSIKSTGSKTHQLLLARCRDILRRYTSEEQDKTDGTNARSALKAVPALVADRVLETLADASAPLDAQTLALIMNAYNSCRLPEKSLRVFEAAVGLSADGSSSEVTEIIEGKKKDDNILVTDIAALDLFTASALLRAHALNGDYKCARRVLAAMEKERLEIDGIESAIWPFDGVVVDTRCYNIVLASTAKAGGQEAMKTGLELFESMADPINKKGSKNAQLPGKVTKNVISYNTIIGAFAKEGLSQDALTIFYGMKQAGVKPDKFTCTSILKALVENDDITAGEEMIMEMKKFGIQPDVVTYNTMIKALCSKLRIFEAKSLVTDMEKIGITPNARTYGLLMNGLIRANKPGPCLTLFETAYADERTSVMTENVHLYTTAITAASRLGDYERALDLVARMKNVGVKPNIKTMTALLGACHSAGRDDIAVNVFKQIEKIAESDGKKPDGYALSLGIRAFCESGDFNTASGLLSEQKDGYHEMSGKEIMFCYNYVIASALGQGKYDVARYSMTELIESGYIPSKTTYRNIVQVLEVFRKKGTIFEDSSTKDNDNNDTEKFEFLLFILDSIIKRKLPCDGILYSAILTEGARMGGLARKVGSLLVKARATTSEQGLDIKNIDSENHPTWADIMEKVASGKHKNKKYEENLVLPVVQVRLGEREMRQVLIAERSVTSRQKRRRGSKWRASSTP